jgi:hypothetical protein
MKVADAVAVAGHEVHVCRYREARTLLRWLGEDLRGLRVLDVAAGDGYWAGQTRKRGAQAVALDLAEATAYGGKFGFNAAAPAAPLVAASDRNARGDGGAIVLVRARRQRRGEPGHAAGQGNR